MKIAAEKTTATVILSNKILKWNECKKRNGDGKEHMKCAVLVIISLS